MARKPARKERKPSRAEAEALDRAQEIAFDAMSAATAKRRVALAQKAIEMSPLCADAWLILSEYAEPGSTTELELLERAVEAGRAGLGDSFAEMEGEFWGWMETRPYMRARHALAQGLWLRERRDEAKAHFQDMLRLNPNDNQGLRYELMGYLADTDDLAGIEALTAQFPEEDMAMWTWPLALAAFRRHGDSEASRKALAAAVGSNGHVGKFLLGKKKLPKRLPDYYGVGDASEAALYVDQFGASWATTPGAVEWLGANSD